MESRAAFLRQCVMNAMADDYENLEHIIDWATKLISGQGLRTSREEIVSILKKVIEDGYAQAYILSSEPPYSTPVPFVGNDSEDLWFYLTPRGLGLVRRVVAPRDDAKTDPSISDKLVTTRISNRTERRSRSCPLDPKRSPTL